jgi:hypothetical protein
VTTYTSAIERQVHGKAPHLVSWNKVEYLTRFCQSSNIKCWTSKLDRKS